MATLQVEKAAVDGERRKVEADLGPVRYLATLIGADSEAILLSAITGTLSAMRRNGCPQWAGICNHPRKAMREVAG